MDLEFLTNLIWQPSFPCDNSEFQVAFNRKFMLEMLDTKTTDERQRAFNQTAIQLLSHLKLNKRPFLFYEDTWFVDQFDLSGNGVWLAGNCPTENYLKEKSSRPIMYHSHNVDHSYQAFELLSIVDLWTRYADTLKDKK